MFYTYKNTDTGGWQFRSPGTQDDRFLIAGNFLLLHWVTTQKPSFLKELLTAINHNASLHKHSTVNRITIVKQLWKLHIGTRQ